MEKDKWWDDSVPKELPYTIAALPFRHETNMSMTEDEIGPTLMLDVPKWHTPGRKSSHASIFSSIKEAVLGRKHSTPESIWSADTGPGSQDYCHFLNSTRIEPGVHSHRRVSTCSTVNNFIPKLNVIEENQVLYSKN